MFRDPFEPLGVDKQGLGSGVRKTVFKFRTGPPGIERGDDRTQACPGIEGHRPFRQIAHRHGDAVALRYAIGPHVGRQRGDRPIKRLKSDALVLMHEKDSLTVSATGLDHRSQGRGRIFPGAHRHTTDNHRIHLEWSAWSGQHGMGRGNRHRRPCIGAGRSGRY